jgi:hypothetical protein
MFQISSFKFYMLKNWLISALILPVFFSVCKAQTAPAIGDEKTLYAETKQLNQFIRRFNNEETIQGERLYVDKDSLYRNPVNRKKYLSILFDNNNSLITDNLKKNFVNDIDNKSKPQYLEFHGGNWFSQANCTVNYKGREEKAIIFLHLQEEKQGSKWVIEKVEFEPLTEQFKKNDNDTIHFMHPLSHEIGFLPMYRAFTEHKNIIQQYTAQEYEPDQTTLFLYEVKKGNIQFKSVDEVKFHIFQLTNWYIEVSNFNRTGYNTGWLISKLVKANEKEKATLKQFIYQQGEK